MNKNNKIKSVGIGSCLAVIIVLAVGLMPIQDQTMTQETKNNIPAPPPTPLADYGPILTSDNDLKNYAESSWVKSPTFIPNGFALDSIHKRSYDELVTYVYLMEPNTEPFDTFRESYKNGIVILFKDASGSDEFHRESLENHIKNDPLKRSFVNVDGYEIFLQEAEDAYDKPARAKLFIDGKNIEAISSQALPMDLAKMISSSLN